jgi:hypothetical protein
LQLAGAPLAVHWADVTAGVVITPIAIATIVAQN